MLSLVKFLFVSIGICFYFKTHSKFSKNSTSPESYVFGAGQENEGSGYEIGHWSADELIEW